jgi:hypothetical protein
MKKSIHFGTNGEIHMYKDDYLVEQPLVVEPSELDSPFMLCSDSGERIVMLVIPTEYSYGSITLAILAKGEEMFNKEELPRFVDHMRGVIKQSAGRNYRAKQQHYGYSGNNRVEGPRILTVLTKDEVRASNKVIGAIKLLREVGGGDRKRYDYEVIKTIGKSLEEQLEDAWKGSRKMIIRHMEMWQHATDITTLLDKPEACYEINQEIVGCLHTSASIGSGLSETHIDHGNAGWEWGGLPDFHVNLTRNDNIGFVVYVPTGEKQVRPVIVVQEIMACTYFYGKNQRHGTIHIGTYLNKFNEHYKVHGKEKHIVGIHESWSKPVVDIESRVFVAYYTKCNLPMAAEILKAYRDIGVEPAFYFRKNGNGKGQDKRARELLNEDGKLDKWVPSKGAGIKTLSQMQETQRDCKLWFGEIGESEKY